MTTAIHIIDQRIKQLTEEISKAEWGSSIQETAFKKAKIEELKHVKSLINEQGYE